MAAARLPAQVQLKEVQVKVERLRFKVDDSVPGDGSLLVFSGGQLLMTRSRTRHLREAEERLRENQRTTIQMKHAYDIKMIELKMKQLEEKESRLVEDNRFLKNIIVFGMILLFLMIVLIII